MCRISISKLINISTVIISVVIAMAVFAAPSNTATVEAAHARKITRISETNTSETALFELILANAIANVECNPSITGDFNSKISAADEVTDKSAKYFDSIVTDDTLKSIAISETPALSITPATLATSAMLKLPNITEMPAISKPSVLLVTPVISKTPVILGSSVLSVDSTVSSNTPEIILTDMVKDSVSSMDSLVTEDDIEETVTPDILKSCNLSKDSFYNTSCDFIKTDAAARTAAIDRLIENTVGSVVDDAVANDVVADTIDGVIIDGVIDDAVDGVIEDAIVSDASIKKCDESQRLSDIDDMLGRI